MAVTERENAFVDTTSVSIGLSQMFNITSGITNPTYVVLSLLDRDEYTAGASGATGTISGNGNTATFSDSEGDARGIGITFTYQASTGQYYNSTYGYLNQVTYTSSSSAGDVTDVSLFGTDNLSLANTYASNPYYMMDVDPSGYLGTATVVTRPGYTSTVPSQATPDSIAATAESFVGQAWNMEGCWVLASTIAAEAGAALPPQSSLIGLPGQSNGEWIVAFDGPAGATGSWQSLVHAGEMIVIGTPGGGGHITTCVSGSGSTAMLVDNITYVNGQGQIVNPANDGSASDVIVSPPHLASQEWTGVAASSVVIYELDTPVVSDLQSSDTLALLASQSLASLFSVTDPGNRSITEWQIYNTAASDLLAMGGVDYSDHSAASALTSSSLGSVSLVAGATQTSDTLEVRAYNGLYWGDWQSLAVTIAGTAPPPPSPPVLKAQTPTQTWLGGSVVSLALPAGTFLDPQGEALKFTATLAGGQPLPSWLTFNSSSDSFSGTAPALAEKLSVVVTATDTSGLSVSDTFAATVIGAPTVTDQTGNQTWQAGKAVSLALPANTFTDPQGEALTYSATQANGQALPSWLKFNPTTETFSGTAPGTTQSLSLKVTATDTSGLSASETFTAAVQALVAPTQPGITVTAPTANQDWTVGQAVDLVLPSNTFTDALGLKMSFAAYELSGPDITSWLRFNPTTEAFTGTPPFTLKGTAELAVIATDAQHLMAVDIFNATFTTGAGNAVAATTEQSGGSILALHFDPNQISSLLAFHS
jgi:hypothetical protein